MMDGVRPEDFPADAQVICTMGVSPAGFDWATCVSRRERQEVLATVVPKFLTFSAVLFFCDITDDEQFQGLLELVYHMDGEQDAPPLFCVHMMPLGETVTMSTNLVQRADVALVVGLQDLMVGCRRGLSLVHQIRASICREQRIMSVLKAKLGERRKALYQNSLTRFHINAILWHDFPQRMRLAIPLVDYELQETETEGGVNGIVFGDVLMSGCWGWMRHAKLGDEAECMKIIQKSDVTNLSGIKAVHHMITCMQDVSAHGHPNILRLLSAMSTSDRLYLRMEHGDQCLHHKLLESKRGTGTADRLSGSTLYSIAEQVVEAVRHIHEIHICHRDLMPESFLCRCDSDGEVMLKLTNFDLAVRQPQGLLVGTSCGTAPFAAPEVSVALNGRYDGHKADIWSTGITLFEIFCGIGIMEQLVSRPLWNGQRPSVEFLLEIQQFFRRGGAVHEAVEHVVPEARHYRGRLLRALQGLMRLDPLERESAEWLKDQMAVPPGCS